MFGPAWKQLRGATFTANRVLGLREQLGAIPLLIDDVNRDRFTREVPDLVKFDRERATLYAPVIISTNKQGERGLARYSQACGGLPDRRSYRGSVRDL
jgi:hypothetical protein